MDGKPRMHTDAFLPSRFFANIVFSIKECSPSAYELGELCSKCFGFCEWA